MTHITPTGAPRMTQLGRFLPGMIVGLLIGLAIALGVTLYVNKVPVPFVNKVPHRTADEDAAEAQRNRNWNPNDPLTQGSPAKPAEPAASLPAVKPPPGVVLPPPEQTVITPPATPPAPNTPASGASNEGGAFFVQAGAFSRQEDAEQHRARLAMINLEGKVSEKVQSGRTIYRVRLGPFEKKADAEAAKMQLELEGIDASLLKSQ